MQLLHANTEKKDLQEISNATVMGLNPTRARNHLGLDFSNMFVFYLK